MTSNVLLSAFASTRHHERRETRNGAAADPARRHRYILREAYFEVANGAVYLPIVIARIRPATALLIITNQIPKSLGLEMPGKGATFFESVGLMLSAVDTVHWAAVGIESGCSPLRC